MTISRKSRDKDSDVKLVVRALALGGVAGLRAMLAPALFSSKLAQKNPDSAAGKIAQALAEHRVATALKALSAGEMIGDKLPQTPDRIAPLPLIARAFSGALVGGAVFGTAKRPTWIGAALGAAAAIGTAYGGYYLRKTLDEKLNLPDPVVALVEDAIAVGIGTSVLASK